MSRTDLAIECMLKAVKQEDNFGCGAACLAFFLKKSYQEVVKELGQHQAQKKGFLCREIVDFLKSKGIKSEYHYLNKKWQRRIYQEATIVFIKRNRRYPNGHYLIRHQNFWMDPWINFPKQKQVKKAVAGFRRRLPGKPIYGVFLI